MVWLASPAVESVINCTTEFDLAAWVLAAVELRGVKREIATVIETIIKTILDSVFVSFSLVGPWLELFES